jgi:3'-phosphoadenosine 5'-phosphosulfate sulfotransferase (PAPS reductase)/FAD synthetase
MNDGEKEKYLIAAQLPQYKCKIKKSMQIVYDALEKQGEWYIAFSGGKDSTVLLDLISKCGWKGKGAYYYYSRFENPAEDDAQVKWANENYGVDIKRVERFGEYDAWKEAGHFFNNVETEEEREIVRRRMKDFTIATTTYVIENSVSNLFMGLTKDESRARKITLSIKGSLYQTKDRTGWTCCPLANWSGTDIWAYTVENNLPYLKVYDLPYWNRDKIRNELTTTYCPDLLLHGEFLQYRMAYPDLFSDLQKEFPEVNAYV